MWDSIVKILKKHSGPALGAIPGLVASASLGPFGGLGSSLAGEAIKSLASLLLPADKKEELGVANSLESLSRKELGAVVGEIDKTLKENPAILKRVQKPLRNLERELQVKLKQLELKVEKERTTQTRIQGDVDMHLGDNEVEITEYQEDTKRTRIKAKRETEEDAFHIDNTHDARVAFSHNMLVVSFGIKVVWAVLTLIALTIIASFFVDDSKMHYARETTLFLFGALCGTIINFFFGSPMANTNGPLNLLRSKSNP